ncbi:MAG: TIR domain-containing protein, partial [Verrucomicrobia bacterium]|nr:TIR domain-containing protein [Verrucomicrobiota bacterium]
MNGAPPAPSASSQGFDVFLSYNSRDHVAVEGIANQLRAQNLKPFLDRWYLGPGLRWRPELEKTLASCKAVAVFFGPDGMGSWQQREVDVALDRQSQAPAFAVIPVLLPGCEPPLGFLRQNTWVDLRSQPEPALLILAKAIRGEPPGPDLQEQFAATRASLCPYRGLLYFREEDAPFFFGREKAIEGLAAAARQKRFLAVVGASGCGKSSVVRAGLVPQLRRDRDTTWEIATLVPGDQPLKALAAALLPFLEPAMTETDRLAEVGKLAGHFASGAISLRDVVQRVLARQPGTDRLLLVADQWEELYTLAPHAEARRRFIDELLDSSVRGPLTVVLTLRGDFVGSALAYRLLCDRLQDAQINLGPMTRAELEQAVTQPAARVGLAFKPGLAERILDDVGDEPGHLPLLEFVLRRLWEARHHGQLLHAAYERMGGLQGAVADKAERFYSTLSGPEQAAVQRLFLQLVRPGEAAEDTRRRERLDEIPESSRDLVKRLADERLLVTTKSAETGEETCEVAHEALIRHWRRFKEWLNADREFLLWRERLRAQLGEWEHADKSEETLLRGPILAEADRWLRDRADRLTPHEHDFITGSTEARERRRQEERDRQQRDLETERELRQTKEASARAAEKRAAEAETHSKKLNLALIAATVMMIVAMVAGRMSLKAKQLAEQSERKASLQLAEAGWLVAKGARGDAFAAREESPIKAAHYLLRAASAAAAAKDGPAVRNASLAAKVAGASLLRSLIHDGAVVGATNSPDRQRILTWSDDGTARLWNAADGKAVSAPMKHEGRVNGALYSPDGQRILTWSFDGTAWLWNATDGKAVGVPMKHEGIVWGADYSADGQRILSWSGDGTARLWNVADGTAMGQLMKHERVYGALYSPDGQRILTWSRSDGYGARCEGRLWSTTDGKAVGEPMTHQNDINGALYSPDGQRILTWSFDGTARLWNATDGKSVGEPMKHEGNVWRARYSADRQRILTWSNEARLWNATDGKSVGEPMKHEG